MKTSMKNSLWMVAAMVLGAGCVGADDSLSATGEAALMTDARVAAATGIARSGKTPHLPKAVSLPTKPAAASAACGDTAPTALVQTGSAAQVNVPAAIGWRYYMDQTPVLYVAAFVKNLCGAHVGRFDFFTPDGTLYRRQQLSFVADANGLNVRKVAGGFVIETELRIAGTEIEGLPMTGVWSVNFTVDNASRAIGMGLFELYR